jgi:pimeloyl-ACP methyl ester carboxylesterase/mannose-6-phosphate isomerase-like protein (cupin superfamily)
MEGTTTQAGQLVDLGGAELYVEVEGQGPPLVLVHGLGLSGALWNRISDALAGHTIVRVDLRGTPRSREADRSELSLQRWADDLATLLERLELETPVLAGHSLGATVALKLALERPELVRALVLIGTEADLSNLAPRMLASAERIERDGTLDGWLEEVWSKNPPFAEPSLARDGGIVDEYRDLLRENDPVDYARQCRAIAGAEPLSGRLAEIGHPALVLVGALDNRTLPEHGRELAAALPNARLVELPEAGHSIPLEAPQETAEAITAFLAELGDRGARVLRAETTPRNARVGPFGHIDVRWVVGPDTGATLIAFGQSTYAFEATHENHHHPDADEVVMCVSGRGTQIVGDRRLDLTPGDICFIPRRTPHRIMGTSQDEDLVILWAFGGAASIEQAGYVPLPDDEEKVQ